MRCFIAIPLPENIRAITLPSNDAGAKLAVVKPENKHLTLKFLGEIDRFQAENVKGLLEKVSFGPFSLTTQGAGVFPPKGKPRVIWFGFKEAPMVMALQKKIDEVLQPLFPPEPHFVPHITLARVKWIDDSELFAKFVHQIKIPPIEATITSFHLLQSELLPEGPKYTVLATVQAIP